MFNGETPLKCIFCPELGLKGKFAIQKIKKLSLRHCLGTQLSFSQFLTFNPDTNSLF
jgi:hypothetical protein